jgi:hypothetical protein
MKHDLVQALLKCCRHRRDTRRRARTAAWGMERADLRENSELLPDSRQPRELDSSGNAVCGSARAQAVGTEQISRALIIGLAIE